MYDENTPEPRTGPDTRNATTFHYQEMAGEGKRKDGSRSYWSFYKRLFLYNTGRWNGKWRNENYERLIENLAMYDSVASQLGLTDRQKGIGRNLFKMPDFRRYSKVGGVRMVAFCTCALVCAEDERNYYPTRKPEANDPEFMRIAGELELEENHIQKAIERLRSELEPYRSGRKLRRSKMTRWGA